MATDSPNAPSETTIRIPSKGTKSLTSNTLWKRARSLTQRLARLRAASAIGIKISPPSCGQDGSWSLLQRSNTLPSPSTVISLESMESTESSWRSIMRQAAHYCKQDDSIASGEFRDVELGVDVSWMVDFMGIQWINKFPDGKIQKIAIPFALIREMQLLDSVPAPSSERRTFHAIFIDENMGTLRVLLIPDFGTMREYDVAWNSWNAKFQHSKTSTRDDFEILNRGIQTRGSVQVAWLFTRKSFSVCTLGSIWYTVKYPHVKDILLHQNNDDNQDEIISDSASTAPGTNTLEIVFFAHKWGLSPLKVTENDIVKRELKIYNFGSLKEFEELCLLWRQELQLQLIDDVFGTSSFASSDLNSAESLISQVARKARDTDRDSSSGDDEQAQEATDCPIDSTLSLLNLSCSRSDGTLTSRLPTVRRADSMRKLYRRQYPSTTMMSASCIAEVDEPSKPSQGTSPKSPIDRVISNSITPISQSMESLFLKCAEAPIFDAPIQSKRDLEIQTDGLAFSPTSGKSQRYSMLLQATDLDEIDEVGEGDIENATPNRPRLSTSVSSCPPPPKVPDMYYARFSYIEPGDGEMKLEKNDKMRIIKKDSTGWWYGLKLGYQRDGMEARWVVCDEGWIPSNYLRLYEEN